MQHLGHRQFHHNEEVEMAVCEWVHMQEPNFEHDWETMSIYLGIMFKNNDTSVEWMSYIWHCNDFSYNFCDIENLAYWTFLIAYFVSGQTYKFKVTQVVRYMCTEVYLSIRSLTEFHSDVAFCGSVRFQGLVAVMVEITVMWHVLPCSSVDRYQNCGGICCLHNLTAQLCGVTSKKTVNFILSKSFKLSC
jgi:hypothetical protein